jgi:hypothetical protein
VSFKDKRKRRLPNKNIKLYIPTGNIADLIRIDGPKETRVALTIPNCLLRRFLPAKYAITTNRRDNIISTA